ncbi:MAG TPA: hypothetical protein PLW65_12340 [Pseudomonadota bacterium]|nr:hypothetical protein [Pseudomonadota bacterium]
MLALIGCASCIPGYLRIGIQTTPATNEGTPLYMLVRAVEPKQHASQSYTEVANLLEAPDGSVVRTQLLYPGRSYRFYLKPPAKGSLGLYFLFTSPEGTWSLLQSPPFPLSLQLALGRSIVSGQSIR